MPTQVPSWDDYVAMQGLLADVKVTAQALADSNTVLSNRLALAERRVADQASMLSELDSRLRALEGPVTPPPPPPPPPYKLARGLTPYPNTPTTLIANETTGGAPAAVRRVFRGVAPAPTKWADLGPTDVTRWQHVVSVKPSVDGPNGWTKTASGAEDAAYRAFFASVPDNGKPVWFAYQHEPEDNGGPEFYIQAQVRLSGLVKEANANRAVPIRFGGVLQAFGSDRWSTYVPPTGTWDFIAFDGYSWPDKPIRSASAIFTQAFETAYAMGFTDVGVGELGNGHPEVDRSLWLRDALDFFTKQRTPWACYFNRYANVLTDAEMKAWLA